MAKKDGGNATPKDDPNDKGNNNEPEDDATNQGNGKGNKAKAGDQGDEDPNEKKYSKADLEAALAQDRQDRRRSQNSKPQPAPAKKKDKGDNEDDDAEADRLRKRADDAEEELRKRDARDALEDALSQAGFEKPRKMFRLLKDDLTFDEKGRPDNIKDLIALAKRDYAEELKPDADPKKAKGSVDAGAKGGVAKGGDMNDFIRRSAGIT